MMMHERLRALRPKQQLLRHVYHNSITLPFGGIILPPTAAEDMGITVDNLALGQNPPNM